MKYCRIDSGSCRERFSESKNKWINKKSYTIHKLIGLRFNFDLR